MNEFTMTILTLGLPGIVCYFLCNKLIGKRQRATTEVVMLVFVYSILSYTIVGLVEAGFSFAGIHSNLIPRFLDDTTKPAPVLMVLAVLASIALALGLSYLGKKSIFNRFAQWIQATNRFGEEDVWLHFHQSVERDWVIVRDLKHDLSYHCYIMYWSDTGADRELVLSDASVYTNSTSDFLYEVRHVYLSRAKDDLLIEVPPAGAERRTEYKVEAVKEQVSENDRQQIVE